METPENNRFSNFQVEFGSMQNPSLISQIPSLSEIGSVSIVAYNFCKWGAVILALLATFRGIVRRVNVLIIKLRRRSTSLPSLPLLDDYDCSSDDEDESHPSSPSSLSTGYEEDEEEEEEEEEEGKEYIGLSSGYWRRVDEDFHVRGSGHYKDDQSQRTNLRRRRSIGDFLPLSELMNSKTVVKLWDSIGLGLGLNVGDYESSIYDVNKAYKINASADNQTLIGAISSSSSPMILTATNEPRNLALKIWDTRLRCCIPAIIAEWRPHLGKIVGIDVGGVQKIYVRDEVADDMTVGDLRNVSSPLGHVAESEADTWWDADAVILSDESYGDESMLQRS